MAGIPQVITEDRASGAQVVEGSLKFDSRKTQYLKRTFSSGNQSILTFSVWLKRGANTAFNAILTTLSSDNTSNTGSWISAADELYYFFGGSNFYSNTKVRDTGWYHVVYRLDTTIASPDSDRLRVYVNGNLMSWNTSTSGSYPTLNDTDLLNSAASHSIGRRDSTNTHHFDGTMSQFYFIDGQSLGPEEFGYTDPLTGTWRPKKYTGDFNISADSYSTDIGVFTIDNTTPNADSTVAYLNSNPDSATYPLIQSSQSSNNTITVKFASAQNGVTSIKFRGGGYSASSTFTLFVNGAQVGGTHNTNTNWTEDSHTISSTNITELKIVGSDGFALGQLKFNDTLVSGTPSYGTEATGANSFYLPLDGNTPIGKDQSGNGNDWTPVNFGGSVELSKATGAIPILNTNDAGTVAKKGVRTDKKTYTVTASGGNYYIDGALKPTLNAYRGGSYTFDYTGATSHPFYLSSLPDGKWNSKAYSVEFDGTGDSCSIGPSSDFTMGTGDFTIECFVQKDNNSHKGILQISDTAGGFTTTNYGTTLAIGYQNGVWQIYGTGGTNATNSSSYPINAGQWYHIAYVRRNSVAKLYVDGVEVISQTDTYNYNGTYIGYGGYYNSSYLHDGKISNLRVVKGQALYTSNFTPPGTTLTTTSQGAIASNVKLICCQDSDAATAAVKPGNITVNGDSAASNTSPFLYDTNGYYGVNTGTSNTTKITIPHWAADTLYYYCNAHSGMGSSINVTTDIRKADPYAWKCVLAIPGGGSILSEVSPQLNVTSSDKTFTQTGTVASSGITNFYGTSTDYAANPDLGNSTATVYATSSQSSDFAWGAGDFTWEWWMYHHDWDNGGGNLDQVLIYQYDGGNTANMIETYIPGHNFTIYQQKAPVNSYIPFESNNTIFTLQNNQWVHCALVREGGYYKFFRDGVYLGKSASNTTSWGDSIIVLGRNEGNDLNGFDGLFQDIRMYGTAKYTASTVGEQAFTVPSVTPDVLPDTPSGITGKTNLAKITEGAVTGFESNSDYLSLAASSDFEFTGDHTIEMFIYHNTLAGDSVPFATGGSGSPDQLYINTIGEFYYGYGQTGSINAPAGTIVVGKWQHIAVSKQGTNLRMFVDGKIVASSTNHSSTIGSSSAVPYIGMRGDGNHFVEGFISNLRIVKGTALYTSEFTPPTEPLTAVTNTKLLCCQSTTSAVSAAVAPGTFVNDGTNYSSGSQVTGSAGLRDVDSIFDGHLRASGNPTLNEGATVNISSDNYILWTPTTGIPYSSKVEVYCYAANGYEITNYYTFNGGTETTFTGGGSNFNGNAWITVATGSGTINSIKIRITRGSGNQTQVNWYAVRVDGTVLINDYSGKSLAKTGNASATNFNPFTDDINTIRGQESGYCTWNPLSSNGGTALDGNLKYSHSGTANVAATFKIPDSGKWFWEYHITRQVSGGVFGIGDGTGQHMRATDLGWWSKIYGYSPNGNKYEGTGSAAYGSTLAAGDLVGVKYDADTRQLEFYKNGSSQGVAFTTSSAFDYYPALHINNTDVVANFGQKPFKFPPPDGFQPLNLSNVQPEKVFARPDQYVGAVLYNGIGTNGANSIDVGHKPDLVWIKERTGAFHHALYDSVRGVQKSLSTSRIDVTEYTESAGLNRFTSTGFDLASGDGYYYVNRNNQPYVAWCWKAGGDKNTFNIDDVGYANASDVNMNVGALNSSVYDQSQNWTALGTGDGAGSPYDWEHTFDGDRSTYGAIAPQGSSLNLDLTGLSGGGISYSQSVVITYNRNSSAPDVTVNGSAIGATADGTDRTYTLTGSGLLTSVGGLERTAAGSGDMGIKKIVVDGKELVDSGVTPTSVPSIAPNGCSVGTKQGFSIVKYGITGSASYDSIPHGLSRAPEFGIFKSTDTGNTNWGVYYTVNGQNTNWMRLNTGDQQGTNTGSGGIAGGAYVRYTDNVVEIDHSAFAASGSAGIAYMWHSVPGLQKFGKYIGNGVTDGPFIEVGFRPAIIWVKNASTDSTNWVVFTDVIDDVNPAYKRLEQNSSSTENTDATTSAKFDILSNGFKSRGGDGTFVNTSGNTYIYCAWAEAPAVNLYGGQSNAR
jgi:hypothetical protein